MGRAALGAYAGEKAPNAQCHGRRPRARISAAIWGGGRQFCRVETAGDRPGHGGSFGTQISSIGSADVIAHNSASSHRRRCGVFSRSTGLSASGDGLMVRVITGRVSVGRATQGSHERWCGS